MNLRKDILDLKNKKAHIQNPIQRAKIDTNIQEREKLLAFLEKRVLPFVNEQEPKLRAMIQDSFLTGADFSIGISQHISKEQIQKEYENQIRKTPIKRNKKKFTKDDAYKRIEERYRKRLERACEYWDTH